MNKKNQIMTVKGFNNSGNVSPIEYEQPYSDCTIGERHYGMPITPDVAMCYKYEFYKQVVQDAQPETPFHNIEWVEFSKSSIFRILSQEGCEFIRFYFAIPKDHNNKASLVLEGLNIDKEPIKFQTIKDIAKQIDKLVNEGLTQITTKEILEIFEAASIPINEEKGNGGPGKGFFGFDLVKSLNDFIDENKEFKPMNMTDFITAFYKYAADHS